jgi:hypothetical protein
MGVGSAMKTVTGVLGLRCRSRRLACLQRSSRLRLRITSPALHSLILIEVGGPQRRNSPGVP